MPTDKKRINLTIPETIYERLQVYRDRNGIASDAGACLQLITRQLDAIESTEKLLAAASKFSVEELQQISNVGVPLLKHLADMQSSNNGSLPPIPTEQSP